MGKIMHGGINYSGSGGSGSSVISLTQDQYDELTPEEKMDPDKVYYISDGVSPGSINYLGVFLDEDNVIQPGTSISGVTTYTATEDCAIVVIYSATTSAHSSVDINNVTVLSFGGANVALRNVLLAKKGDVVKFTPAGTYNTYYVYGLKHGSSTGTGGSVVEPNPEDPATDELTKIGIDGTVYSVSGASAVSELTDVELTDLSDGEILKYDATEEKWVNVEDGGSGDVNVYGAFIDTNRKLHEATYTNDATIPSYTALEDCFVSMYIYGKASQHGIFSIDSEKVTDIYFVREEENTVTLFVKKGQTLEVSLSQYYNFTIIVHALQQGTNNIFAPVIYSLEEREVGVWTDGKPLYQKTIYSTSQVTLVNTEWRTIPWVNAPSNIENLIHAKFAGIVPYSNAFFRFYADSGMIKGAAYNTYDFPPTQAPIYVTIQYTKTTDTPGSGSYAELGVSAVHYDDTERIIGTYFGETLYRKTVKIASLPSSATGDSYPHGISDIKEICAVYAFAKWSNGQIAPMNMVQIVGGNFIVNASIYYSVDKTNITINPGSDRSALSGVVTIEYTKTTS